MALIEQESRDCDDVDNDPPMKRTNSPTVPDAIIGESYIHDFNLHFADASALTFELHDAPAWMSINNGITGGVVPSSQADPLEYTIVATDAQGLSSSCRVSVEVITPVGNPPEKVDPEPSVNNPNAGQLFSHDFNANFTHPDSDPLTYQISEHPIWMSISNGVVSGTVPNNVSGEVTFTITATDTDGQVLSCTYKITVQGINQPPVKQGSTTFPNATVGQTYGKDFNGHFADPEGGTITLSLRNEPSWLSIGGGIVVGNVPANFTGPLTYDVVATDELGAETVCAVTVLVNPSECGDRSLVVTATGNLCFRDVVVTDNGSSFTLRNITNRTLDMSGWWVCIPFLYDLLSNLDPSAALDAVAPGASVTLQKVGNLAGATGPEILVYKASVNGTDWNNHNHLVGADPNEGGRITDAQALFRFPVSITSNEPGTVDCWLASTVDADRSSAIGSVETVAIGTQTDLWAKLVDKLDGQEGTFFLVCELAATPTCPMIRRSQSFEAVQCSNANIEPLVITDWDTIADGPGANETTATLDLANVEGELAGLDLTVVPRDISTADEGTNAVGSVNVSGSVLTWIAPKGAACDEHRIRLSTVPNPNICNCPPRTVDLEVHAPSTDTACIIYRDDLVAQVGPTMRSGYGGSVDNAFLAEIAGTPIEEFLGDYQDSGLVQPFAGPWMQAVDLSGNVMPNLRIREATTTALGLKIKESLLFDPSSPTSAKYEVSISDTDGQVLAAFGQTRSTYQNQPLGVVNAFQTTEIDQLGTTFNIAFCFDNLQPIFDFDGLAVPRIWNPGDLLVCIEWSP